MKPDDDDSHHPTPETEEWTPLEELQRRFAPIVQFVRTEIFSSIALVAVTILAIGWANSPWFESYFQLVNGNLTVSFEGRAITHTTREWINDGLMTLFFFLIGLEIKRELVTGRLRDRRAAALPAFAAVGGMVCPALVYAAFTAGGPAAHGWAIPMSTDIAFAVGLLGLLRDRVPADLRLFLLTAAIIDDIAGILVIAIFYSKGLSMLWLSSVALIPFLLFAMRWFGVRRFVWYVMVGILAWFCTLMSGVHPTIAGVIVGLMTPAMPIDGRKVLEMLEHSLHPWIAFGVVPLFAFANAGVRLDWEHLSDALNRQVTWGVSVGLVVGKIIGVSLFSWFALRLGVASLPQGIRLQHICAMSPLTGVGFTVALVIAALSFEQGPRLDAAKIGTLAGSALAAGLGLLFLWRVSESNRRKA